MEFSSETFSSLSDLQENFLEISSFDRIIILADSQYESAHIKKIYPTAVVIVMGYQISHTGDFFLSKPMKSKSLYEVLYQIITGSPIEIIQSPKYCLLRQSDVKILVVILFYFLFLFYFIFFIFIYLFYINLNFNFLCLDILFIQ